VLSFLSLHHAYHVDTVCETQVAAICYLYNEKEWPIQNGEADLSVSLFGNVAIHLLSSNLLPLLLNAKSIANHKVNMHREIDSDDMYATIHIMT
jgi:hypothetical protein